MSSVLAFVTLLLINYLMQMCHRHSRVSLRPWGGELSLELCGSLHGYQFIHHQDHRVTTPATIISCNLYSTILTARLRPPNCLHHLTSSSPELVKYYCIKDSERHPELQHSTQQTVIKQPAPTLTIIHMLPLEQNNRKQSVSPVYSLVLVGFQQYRDDQRGSHLGDGTS